MKIRLPTPLIFFLLLGLSGVWIWISSQNLEGAANFQAEQPAVGFIAPDFELTSLDGQRIKLSELKGKAVIINFWASWCPPCRSEMPAIQNIFNEYLPEDFVILAVNVTNIDSDTAAYKFVKENQLTFPVLFDRTGMVSTLYQTNSLPTSFFIDQEGKISDIVVGGPISEAFFKIQLDKLLGESE